RTKAAAKAERNPSLPSAKKPVRTEVPLSKAPAPSRQPPPRPGAIDEPTEKKLKRGRIAIDATLDLHGLTQSAAHARLTRFLIGASAEGHKAVLVITGKGGSGTAEGGIMPSERRGVLRSQLPLWLHEPPLGEVVIGIKPAGPRHGGAGAFYVLLRRQKLK